MEQYIIKGGNPLVGEVEIGGEKNAALAILAAAIMTDETVLIDNLPDVNDVNVLLEAIQGIGAMVQRIDRHTVKINGSTITSFDIEYDYIKKIEQIVKEGIEKKEIKEGNPKVIASEIYGLICSTLVYKLRNEKEIDIMRLYKEFENTVIEGLKIR